MLIQRRSWPVGHACGTRTSITPRLRHVGIRRALGADTIAINEETILLASVAASVTLPFAFSYLKSARIQEVTLSAAQPGAILLDIRTQEQRSAEGLPAVPHGVKILHAPWMIYSESGFCRRNVHFQDDVMFAATGAPPGTPLIVMDMAGECGPAAASAVAKLGSHCRVQLAKGGFQAWQAAGMPTRPQRTVSGPPLLNTEDLMCELEHEPEDEPVFRPKILDVLASGYSTQELKADILSGLVVGVIALSLSMALGIASESTPAVGLTTAVIAGFLISALGGSRVCIGGPTAAFIPIVVGVAHNYGSENLVICTGMSGLMLMAMGATGLGSIIKFIPKPVVTGFTAGIATYIFSTQIKDFLGLGVPGALPEGSVVPAQFLEKLYFLGKHLDGTHVPSLALAGGCLALMLAWPKHWAKVAPPQIVTVVVATAGLTALDHAMGGEGAQAVMGVAAAASSAGAYGIETIGSHFGADAIPSGLPMPHWPAGLNGMQTLGPLMQPALSIALLGSIESLLCARVSDTMIGDKHNPNTELIAQGIANIASAAFGGLPATGALARTAANVRAGGRSPVAGMVHAATILTVMVVAAPLAAYIPLPALSAVLVIVAINMGEWRHFRQLTLWPEKDAQLFLLAFFLTVMQDVAVAVELGMAAAVLLYVRDVTHTLQVRSHQEGDIPQASLYPSLPRDLALGYLALTSQDPAATEAVLRSHAADEIEMLSAGEETDEDGFMRAPLTVPAGAAYLDVTGSLLFGGGEQLEQAVAALFANGGNGRPRARVLVLGMHHLSMCDVSGLEVLEELAAHLKKDGVSLVLVGVTQQPLQMMSRAGFLHEVGVANVCRTLDAAFARAKQLIALAPPLPPTQYVNNVVPKPARKTVTSASVSSNGVPR